MKVIDSQDMGWFLLVDSCDYFLDVNTRTIEILRDKGGTIHLVFRNFNSTEII